MGGIRYSPHFFIGLLFLLVVIGKIILRCACVPAPLSAVWIYWAAVTAVIISCLYSPSKEIFIVFRTV